MIQINSLSKHYPDGQNVFSNLNFLMSQDQRVGVFGENGTGKTTLMNIIAGMEKTFKGQVVIKANRVSYVHQDPTLTLAPWFTCEKNILLGREYRKLSPEKGERLLGELSNELDVAFPLTSYPNISGGQRQIVALLRALIQEPDLLILDEPFSHLDAKKRNDVVRLLGLRFQKIPLLISSHRGDEVKSLINRAVILQGQPAQIVKDIAVSETFPRAVFEEAISSIHFREAEHETI